MLSVVCFVIKSYVLAGSVLCSFSIAAEDVLVALLVCDDILTAGFFDNQGADGFLPRIARRRVGY